MILKHDYQELRRLIGLRRDLEKIYSRHNSKNPGVGPYADALDALSKATAEITLLEFEEERKLRNLQRDCLEAE